jgi:FAD/FMN-containing dehydrogenase
METLNPSLEKLTVGSIHEFKKQLGERLMLPGDPQYDEARKIWNGMFDKKPRLIARCQTAQEVASAVNFAREHHLVIAVKGGGHNSAGTASCEGGLMIDLSLMRKIEVNEQTKTAKVQGGCLLGEVDAATQKFGLAVPSGIISHTGVGGLTLGGGFGWISRKYGLSVDNLIAAEVVTADGRIVEASEQSNPDLFWAIRGGGGNFGIVTNFEFNCAAIGTEVYSGVIVKKFEDINAYIRFHRSFVRTLPDEMTVWMVVRKAPPLPFLPESTHGKLAILIPFVWLGDPEQGRELLQPLREITESLGEGSGMNPWINWQSGFDVLATHGARNYWKSHHLTDMPDAFVDVLNEYAKRFPSDDCEIFIPHMEGAPARIPAHDTAFSHRSTPFLMNIHTRWQNPSDDTRCLQWAKDFHEATKPFSMGVYVNFLSDEGEDRIRQAYTEGVWNKLVTVKRKWDPENIFRINQNIKPD